jgi:diguanylate cyclase (GGDEF)-like protein
VIGTLLLAPAVTLLALYLFHRRPYILAWVASWVALGAMVSLLSFEARDLRLDLPDDRPLRVVIGRLIAGGWALCGVIYAGFLLWGGVWFRSPAFMPRRVFAWVGALAAWFVVVALVPALPLAAILAPTFVIVGTLLGAGAWTYLRKFLTHRFAGALVTGGALALTTVCYVAIGLIMSRFGRATPDSVAISYASGVLAVFIAFGMHLLVFEDITTELRASNDALARARDELRAMAVTDPLTSCYNRRFFDEIARHELEQHRRYALPLSLLFMDCDRFKAVNDSRGHETGDRVLRTIGQILRGSIREADYAFRWGGDEFLVMITAHEPQARAKAEEIRLLFQSSPILAELPEGVDLSFGCAAVPADTEDLRAVIEQADRDMYKRKRQVKSA